ncbi:MAG: hypothetical protein EBX41_01385 [Chitinophagia bacterium]|nr:hypothetical protein [Chitinophagia bacterium]
MLKYSVGLDISSKSIQACLSVIDANQRVTVKSSGKFDNELGGFKKMSQWIEKHYKDRHLPLAIDMEATGVYYEKCALFIFKAGYAISVLLPNKAKKWMEADGIKSKNDSIDAQGLSKMCAEKQLEVWQPSAEYYYQLRELTRHYQCLQEQKQ